MSWVTTAARRTILGVSQNAFVRNVATRHGFKLGAGRFVAGETLDEALAAVKSLNDSGIVATLDHLGEYVTNAAEADQTAEACLAVLDGIEQTQVQCNLSLKLTSLGLDLDGDLCRQNMRRIVAKAAAQGNFVRIDMEDSERTDKTLSLLRELVDEFGPAHIGTVIQAYLFRSEADLAELGRLETNVRLVKGAYMEPASVAFPAKADVDNNFIKLIHYYLQHGPYTAVATHDPAVIENVREYVAANGISPDRFEFQMLYGIRRDLQAELAQNGYRVRVYVPFGTDWYGYFTRRLAERPANLGFLLSNLFKN